MGRNDVSDFYKTEAKLKQTLEMTTAYVHLWGEAIISGVSDSIVEDLEDIIRKEALKEWGPEVAVGFSRMKKLATITRPGKTVNISCLKCV